jgi:hypothetical protein
MNKSNMKTNLRPGDSERGILYRPLSGRAEKDELKRREEKKARLTNGMANE